MKTRVEGHAGGSRCLIRIETLIIGLAGKKTANGFGPLSLLFVCKGQKGERQRGNGERESEICK